jgi:predicted dehydrogenase
MTTPVGNAPLRVAIVGCGKIADGHVEEIQKMPAAARVVAVADLELLMAEQIARRYGIPAYYDDLDRLLATEKPDVVHITTPPQSHLPLATKAIDAGAHVLVEKPLTLTHADSRRLVAHARAAGRKLTIGYSYYFDPPVAALRELHARGGLGDPVHAEAFLGYSLASPFGKAVLGDAGHWVHRMPGKLFQNNLDHVLYKLLPFLPDGRPDPEVEDDPLGPLRITAQGWIRRRERFGDGRDAMLDELRVQFTGPGASASAWFSSHLRPAAQFTRVYGTRGTALAHQGTGTLTLDSEARLPSALGRLTPAFGQGMQFLREGARNLLRFGRNDFHYFAGMNRLFALFYRSIAEDGPPPIPYRDLLRISGWMDEIWRQVPQQDVRA